MTNPVLTNRIATDEVILWQYDKAINLIRLIQKWNQFATVSCEEFWNYFGNSIFPIDLADTYGLNVWGNLLGIPRPTIRIPTQASGDTNWDEKDDFVTVPSTKDADGKWIVVEGYDEYGYNPDGYRVSEISEDEKWKVVTIENTLYRGLLKGRFFLMCHTPTVPNYNKYLAIVFGAEKSGSDDNPIYDIFDNEGNVRGSNSSDESSSDESSSDVGFTSRNQALDFMNMSMGFTFPTNASVEEAYLIFQHYDVVYQFPAGIRYPGEFICDDLVIGLNTDQDSPSDDNQYYKNFVDGLVQVEDKYQENPDGGIFAATERANYKREPAVEGAAYICQITAGNSIALSITNNTDVLLPVWVDFGNGNCGYRYLPSGGNTITSDSYSSTGLYSVIVFFPAGQASVTTPTGAHKYNISQGD